MRRLLLVLALAAAIGMAVMPSQAAQDVGKQYGCDSTSAATALGVVPGPSCSFDVECLAFGGPASVCGYLVRISASGTGLVSAAMSASVAFDDPPGSTTISWSTTDDPDADPPSCEGAFRCTAPAEGDGLFLVVEPDAISQVTITCTADGTLAVVETVSCSAVYLEIEE